MAARINCLLSCSACGVFKSLYRFCVFIDCTESNPIHFLARRIFLHRVSIKSRGIVPSNTAFLIADIATAASFGNSKTSFPASSAFFSNSPGGKYFVTPFMLRASVNINPSNPKSFCNSCVIIL